MDIKIKDSIKKNIFFPAGLFATILMMLPYMILREDSAVIYHDQLDGEMIAYILGAKHLFEGGRLPEIMGGLEAVSLMPPAPLFVLFFRMFPPFTALLSMGIAGRIIGYIGMYLLLEDITHQKLVSAGFALCFSMLPFLWVYGLSQYGIPLLFFLVIRAERERKQKIAGVIYAVVYALSSSLVLVGYAILGILLVYIIYRLLKREKICYELLIFSTLLLTYILSDMELFRALFGQGFISHKTEYALVGENALKGFAGMLLYNGEHSEDFHIVGLAFLIFFLVYLFFNDREGIKRFTPWAVTGVFLYVFSALWNSELSVSRIRCRLGALGAFQADRVLWVMPVIWYAVFGLAAAGVWEKARRKAFVGGFMRFAALLNILLLLSIILYKGDIKPNIMKLLRDDYRVMSYGDYYANGVMDEAREYLLKYTGKSIEDFRVASLGIDPAASLYHGFYTIDGYSNNYSVDYKHSFRRIIAPELKKSEYLTAYFDGWGNRCYLYSAETPAYFTIEKGGFYYKDYSMDLDAFKGLSGDYILSAAYIENAEEAGLRLLNREAFETGNSYYHLYIYEPYDEA
ncbi:MAG: hypothetical protein IJ608_07565 [Lachnospiraceae bacterium]|nr:hypothetical protein [Lachnospiraceae bacterium]